MDEELNDYERWMEALPRRWEVGLTTSDAAKTAFWQARRRGWDVDDLIVDALNVAKRNQEGIGIVVVRLRQLSEIAPIKRGRSTGLPADLSPDLYEEWEAAADPDKERMIVLNAIRANHLSPDDAGDMMDDLNALLRHRHGVVSGFRRVIPVGPNR